MYTGIPWFSLRRSGVSQRILICALAEMLRPLCRTRGRA